LSDYLPQPQSEPIHVRNCWCRRRNRNSIVSKGDKKAYDLALRPRLMVETILQLQDAGVEAGVWKIEGLDRREDCENIVAARGGAMAGTPWLHHPGPR
jgi:hypothetical protein